MGKVSFWYFWDFQSIKLSPEYLFRAGITDENSLRFKVAMQKEILVQALANAGPLSLPMMIQVTACRLDTSHYPGAGLLRPHRPPHQHRAAGLGRVGAGPGLGAHGRQAEEEVRRH